MRQSLFDTAGEVLRRAGAGRVSRLIACPDNVRVLVCHDVHETQLDQFSRLVRYAVGDRQPMPPDQFFRHYASDSADPIRGRWIMVTFDDGLASSYRAVQAVLDPMEIKAIFFVPTVVLEFTTEESMRHFTWTRRHRRGEPESLYPDEYLTIRRSQLRELLRQGHMVLPHTHTHMSLSVIDTQALVEQEITYPKRVLEDLLQVPVDGLSLPYGNERSVSGLAYSAIRSDYSLCFTSLFGANSRKTDPLFLHRDPIHPADSVRHMANVLGGAYDLPYRRKLKRLKRNARPRA